MPAFTGAVKCVRVTKLVFAPKVRDWPTQGQLRLTASILVMTLFDLSF
jgi:hypothetical protein